MLTSRWIAFSAVAGLGNVVEPVGGWSRVDGLPSSSAVPNFGNVVDPMGVWPRVDGLSVDFVVAGHGVDFVGA